MKPTVPGDFSVTGLILAGGRGTRMGGVAKGLLVSRGQRLIDTITDVLQPQVHQLLISGDPAVYGHLGFPVLRDAIPRGLGPLAGQLAGLEQATTDFVVTVPCDTPTLPPDLVTRMVARLSAEAAEVCTVLDSQGEHPVINLTTPGLAMALRHYLENGGRAVGRWLKTRGMAVADFSDRGAPFLNLNTPEELQHLEQLCTLHHKVNHEDSRTTCIPTATAGTGRCADPRNP
ncbi:MAG: molybdenum cofactor guanylyltransferase MobA [Pseudomonadota bacterium]